ncbi:MAG TPA: DUF5686 family protein [Bacteroidota bacterium]|nr:DUF5686 family protein [Bacteroidota bacterium]
MTTIYFNRRHFTSIIGRLMKFFLLLFPALLFSQTHKIHGLVVDDSTRQCLSYATIRVERTDIVASTNKEGAFILELPEGEYALLVTYVGYNSKTETISIPKQSSVTIGLAPALIQMPEVSIAADAEDPAIEIMRYAIKRREKNYEGLKNYDITGYKKNIVFKGDQVAMIDEKFIKHVYEKGRMSKEFVYSTHKTENIKNQAMNINLNVGWALFFAYGSINVRVGKATSTPVFPLADRALQYYDFKLLQTKYAGKNATHIIQVIPRTNLEPLIRGKIFIDDATGAVIGADVETNEGWRLPLVQSFVMKIQQTYANYDGFWIPQYSELSMAGKISALGGLFSMDRMEISEVYSSSSCKVNGTIPDSLRLARRSKYGGYTTDTTKRVSSLKRTWKTKKAPEEDEVTFEPAAAPPELSSAAMTTIRPLPLTTKETVAFARLDSTQTLDKILAPKGALGAISSSSSDPGLFGGMSSAARKYGMIHNNRVEGVSLGAHIESDEMSDDFYYNAAALYAFGLKRIEAQIGGGFNLGDDHLDRIDANVWDDVRPWQTSTDISKTINTIGFTLTGKDYFNYLRSTGISLGIHKYFTDYSFVKLYFAASRERSVADQSIVSLRKDRRLNPAILEGQDNTLQLQLGYRSDDSRFETWGNYSVEVNAALSHPNIGSDFNYQRVFATVNVNITTLYATMFSSPFIALRAEGGGVFGNKFGMQHMPAPNASLSVYAPFGVLKGLQQYELAGEQCIAVQAEHNWQALPFFMLGMNSVGATGLQIITGASVANVWNTTPFYAAGSTWKPYWEAYVGLGNILDVLRIDVIRTSRKQTVVRLGISTLI